MLKKVSLNLGFMFVALFFFAAADSTAQAKPQMNAEEAPLRVALAGLVHGHAFGFFDQFQRRTDLQVVGIAEADRQLTAQFAKRYSLEPGLFYSDLEEMLRKTHPQAVLAYTNTYDHRRVVEICARYSVPVMMEKPLAVSLEDARAIEKAARAAKIQVLVNYETTWYRSNQAAYDLVHGSAIGEIRKIVVHDGHRGPKEIGVGPEFLAWLTDPKLNGGGALFDFGCYGADLATFLTYPRAQAIIQASWNWPFSRKDMEVYGERGYAITVARDQLRMRLPEKAEISVDAKPLEKTKEDSVSYLRAVILGSLKPDGQSSLETNLIVTEILDAARQSAATGKTVSLSGTR